MPAKFSDDEKIQLREALVNSAKEAFLRFGLKKTSVGRGPNQCPSINQVLGTRKFPIQKRDIFRKIKEIEGFRGDVHWVLRTRNPDD